MGFVKLLRACSVVALGCLSLLSFSQQGGFGGGAGGAGFGGGGYGQGSNNGLDPNDSYPKKNGDTIEDSNNWIVQTMILTQGDRVEWKVSGKKGQTLFAYVISDVFDPALSVVGPDGKVLVENDDQREGDQSPFLTYFFPDDKEYKITVKNYRSTAGGKFKLYSRILPTVTLTPGKNIVAYDEKTAKNYEHGGVLRIVGEKGKIFSITTPQALDADRRSYVYTGPLVGPTGVSYQDIDPYSAWGDAKVFETKSTGDYFLLCQSMGSVGFSVNFGEVGSQTIDQNATLQLNLKPHEFKILKYPVKQGDVIHTVYGFGGNCEARTYFEPKPEEGETRPSHNYTEQYVRVFGAMLSRPFDYIKVYTKSGNVTVVANSTGDNPTQFSYSNSTNIPDLAIGKATKSKLQLGQTDTYKFKASRREMLRMHGAADGMELQYTIMDDMGRESIFMDRIGHKPDSITYLEPNRTYVIAVTSAGGGGMGEYSLDSLLVKPKEYKIGAVQNGDPSDSVLNTFSVDLEANTTYQVAVMGANISFALEDMDGGVIRSSAYVPVEGGYVQVFKVKEKGSYRIHFNNGTAASKFRMDVFKSSLGG